MESEAAITGDFRGVEGRAGIMAAVASVAGFVNELAGIVAGGPEVGGRAADGSSNTATGSSAAVAADDDPLASFADACLDGLAVLARVEAATAAVKVRLVDGHVGAVAAMADPTSGPAWVKGREMASVAEVACVLTIGERAAGALIGEAHALTGSLPAALDALQAGEVSWSNARVLVDETTGLDHAATAALEAHFLGKELPAEQGTERDHGMGPVQEPLPELSEQDDPASGPGVSGGFGVGRCLAGELPPARLRRRVRSWRERHQPESIEARHVRGVADRRMECTPERDGMACVSLVVPADRAMAIWNRTTAIARGMQGPDEPRTLTQLRPDIAVELLLGAGFIPDDNTAGNSSRAGIDCTTPGGVGEPATGIGEAALSMTADGFDAEAAAEAHAADGVPGAVSGAVPGAGAVPEGYLKLGKAPAPRAQVLVMVPALSMLGITDEPALLDGHGPIPASMARKLIAEGADSFYRVLVDPRDGAPLEIGRTSYRVGEVLRRWLRLRDGKCPFPGCSNNSLDNEADHLLAWQHGGTTGISNLGQPCPKHHRMKHTSGWEPTPATMNEPPGYISPFGRHYKSETQEWEPPHLPPALLPGNKQSAPRLDAAPPETLPEELTDEPFPHAPLPFPQPPDAPLPFPEPPDAPLPFPEPPADLVIDEDDIPPDDSGWNILLCSPITLPPLPSKDWKLALT